MDEYRIRVRIFTVIVLTVLGILSLRLAQLQLVDVDEYTGESRSNAVRERRVQPARGAIFDRNGVLMIDNEPTYTLLITPRRFDRSRIHLLAELLGVPDTTVQNKLDKARSWSAFQPSKAFREVPFDVLSRILENIYRLPGVDYEVEEKRRYVTDARAAHAMGYIREISDRELRRRRSEGYRQGDLIGQAGIERNYEGYLRGRLGSAYKLVNVHGLEVKSYLDGREDTPPISGYSLVLGIDARVQALAESLFVNKRGGAVAIDPQTGEIIAMVSKPDFDPDVFARTIEPAMWDYLNNSPEKPLYNRATMNLMPPGSTWKPFMSLMSLQEGNIKPGEKVYCGGGHPIGGGRFFRCMKAHGSLSVVEAIQASCNTFFFEMMNRTDPNTFEKYAHMFGFGVQAPTDISEQTAGLIPDSMYFFSRWGEAGLKPGFTLNLGIGQGNMGVTPLQLARYVAAVGNGGTLHPPHLVRELRHPETGEVLRPALPPSRQIPIEKQYFDLVREGMKRVMEAGTGRGVQIPGIPAGGKTGTAQSPPGRGDKDDSVFIIFAPWDDPQIAVAVQVENAGFGASAAAPIASLMAELYLTGRIAPERQAVVQRAMSARSEPLPRREKKPEPKVAEAKPAAQPVRTAAAQQ